MRWGLGAVVWLAVTVSVGAGEASAQEPRIRASVDTTVVTVGGRLELLLTVEHDPGATVLWPDSLDVSPFEVLEAVTLRPTQRDGRTFSAARLSLAAFELGELEIPSIEVQVVGADSMVTALATDPFGIGVETVGLDQGDDIRGIRGPLAIPRGLMALLPWLLLAAGLVALAYWVYRRGQDDASAELGRVVLPGLPHEDAYEALDELEGAGLLQRGEVKEFHIRVSEIIRTYVEGRFDIYALEMTTPEVMAGLRSCEVDGEVHGEFAAFLDRCDLVKFAKVRPGVDACFDMLGSARRIVDQTKPTPVLIEVDPASGVSEPVEAVAGAGVE
ncbi:MAG: hypothetical protein ACC667_08335 [Longimicrobiales bacterium]